MVSLAGLTPQQINELFLIKEKEKNIWNLNKETQINIGSNFSSTGDNFFQIGTNLINIEVESSILGDSLLSVNNTSFQIGGHQKIQAPNIVSGNNTTIGIGTTAEVVETDTIKFPALDAKFKEEIISLSNFIDAINNATNVSVQNKQIFLSELKQMLEELNAYYKKLNDFKKEEEARIFKDSSVKKVNTKLQKFLKEKYYPSFK